MESDRRPGREVAEEMPAGRGLADDELSPIDLEDAEIGNYMFS